ncbi:MAG TPA: hypothetical protein VNB06_12810, partial [Thermoanaerobaculia bacterium]|nr:hypothetical protein [Thermoanaerobaculia bacterium]
MRTAAIALLDKPRQACSLVAPSDEAVEHQLGIQSVAAAGGRGHGVAAASLGIIQRCVGGGEQLLVRLAVGGRGGHAD